MNMDLLVRWRSAHHESDELCELTTAKVIIRDQYHRSIPLMNRAECDPLDIVECEYGPISLPQVRQIEQKGLVHWLNCMT